MPLDFARIQAVFLSAMECREPAARAALLDRECGPDANLRQRVEELLRASDESQQPPRSTDRRTRHRRRCVLSGPRGKPVLRSPTLTRRRRVRRVSTRRSIAVPVSERSSGVSDDDPSKIGRYLVIDRLGQGGFGRVYLARDDDLDRRSPSRCPTPNGSAMPKISKRF